ncbi:hypothetical protein GCM10023100_38430 [Actinocorallia cavernae]|uniref:Uncharacterized protein n=2 Tax=Actinomycetes TaxID=1760 RepID=A0ABP8SS68_9ACTN
MVTGVGTVTVRVGCEYGDGGGHGRARVRASARRGGAGWDVGSVGGGGVWRAPGRRHPARRGEPGSIGAGGRPWTGWSGALGKGCEPTPYDVLMFCMSEGASPKGQKPEDTPNARVAE